MKFYETFFEDYIKSVESNNFHLKYLSPSAHHAQPAPHQPHHIKHHIFFGPAGIGKYSQMLLFLKPFSPSLFKFHNKLLYSHDNFSFLFHFSDIHFEIDFNVIHLHSKLFWQDLFSQIIDIFISKHIFSFFIVFNNFNLIHFDFLHIFHSFFNHFTFFFNKNNDDNFKEPTNFEEKIKSKIDIKFIILTENISFIPNDILKFCNIFSFSRPSNTTVLDGFVQRFNNTTSIDFKEKNNMQILENVKIHNLKDVYSLQHFSEDVFERLKKTQRTTKYRKKNDKPEMNIPMIHNDHFYIICNNIIQHITTLSEESQNANIFSNYTEFRDILYDILIYNLEPLETVCHIFFHFLKCEKIDNSFINEILQKMEIFMFQFENNYRSFFHIEHFIFTLLFFIRKTNMLTTINTMTNTTTIKKAIPQQLKIKEIDLNEFSDCLNSIISIKPQKKSKKTGKLNAPIINHQSSTSSLKKHNL